MISNQSLEFYNKNKDVKWKMPGRPHGVNSYYDTADWLLNHCNFGWLELDIEIDLEDWKKESQHSKDFMVPHREDNNNGWNSCCIHGISVDKTGAWTNYGYKNEDAVPYNWTELSELTPNIKKFWQKFPYDNYRRIRFMELESNSAITPHSDMPGRLPGEENFNALEFGVPINVAIDHPLNCDMVLQDHGIVPFREGKAFIVNIRNYHSVVNFSNQPRMHLIAHGKLSNKKDEFVDLIARSYHKQYERDRI